MNSRQELLDMIATEAVEQFGAGREISKDSSQEPVMRYDLRLVRYEDGRLEWEE